MPVIIGGVEASLRRFAHYDYWSDSVMQSILTESGADMLIYGMGERPIWDILDRLSRHIPLTIPKQATFSHWFLTLSTGFSTG